MQTTNLHEMTTPELIDSFVEIEVKSSDDFLKIRETLTRMGVPNQSKDVLYQSCHILHKRGRYYVVHFKELFALDGKLADMTDEDYARRNTIANILESWNMCKILTPENSKSPILGGRESLTIIPFSKKRDVELRTKYMIGKKKED